MEIEDPRERPPEDVLWMPDDVENASVSTLWYCRGFDHTLPDLNYVEPYPEVIVAESHWMLSDPFKLITTHTVLVADDEEQLSDSIADLQQIKPVDDPESQYISATVKSQDRQLVRRIERRENVLSFLITEGYTGTDVTQSQIDTENGVMKPWS